MNFHVRINTSIFGPIEPVSIIDPLSLFKRAYGTDGMGKVAVMCFLYLSLRKSRRSLSSGTALGAKLSREFHMENVISTKCWVVHFCRESYATHDFIMETDPYIMNINHLLNKTPMKYAELLQVKALRCYQMYSM